MVARLALRGVVVSQRDTAHQRTEEYTRTEPLRMRTETPSPGSQNESPERGLMAVLAHDHLARGVAVEFYQPPFAAVRRSRGKHMAAADRFFPATPTVASRYGFAGSSGGGGTFFRSARLGSRNSLSFPFLKVPSATFNVISGGQPSLA
jgi:hypothetical protein